MSSNIGIRRDIIEHGVVVLLLRDKPRVLSLCTNLNHAVLYGLKAWSKGILVVTAMGQGDIAHDRVYHLLREAHTLSED